MAEMLIIDLGDTFATVVLADDGMDVSRENIATLREALKAFLPKKPA